MGKLVFFFLQINTSESGQQSHRPWMLKQRLPNLMKLAREIPRHNLMEGCSSLFSKGVGDEQVKVRKCSFFLKKCGYVIWIKVSLY